MAYELTLLSVGAVETRNTVFDLMLKHEQAELMLAAGSYVGMQAGVDMPVALLSNISLVRNVGVVMLVVVELVTVVVVGLVMTFKEVLANEHCTE
jgi:hypothetical protein